MKRTANWQLRGRLSRSTLPCRLSQENAIRLRSQFPFVRNRRRKCSGQGFSSRAVTSRGEVVTGGPVSGVGGSGHQAPDLSLDIFLCSSLRVFINGQHLARAIVHRRAVAGLRIGRRIYQPSGSATLSPAAAKSSAALITSQRGSHENELSRDKYLLAFPDAVDRHSLFSELEHTCACSSSCVCNSQSHQ